MKRWQQLAHDHAALAELDRRAAEQQTRAVAAWQEERDREDRDRRARLGLVSPSTPEPSTPSTSTPSAAPVVGATRETREPRDIRETRERLAPLPSPSPSTTSTPTDMDTERQRDRLPDRHLGDTDPGDLDDLENVLTDFAGRLPPGRSSIGFKLARRLKTCPDLRDIPFRELRVLLEGVEQRQNHAGRPRWWPLLADDYIELLDDLAHAWTEVRHAEGENRLLTILRDADRTPLKVLESMDLVGDPVFRRFFSYVRAAAVHAQRSGGNVLLPCQELGDLLGVNKKTIWRWRKRLERAGILEVLVEHAHPAARDPAHRGASRATEFLVSFDRMREHVEEWPPDEHGELVTGTAVITFTDTDDDQADDGEQAVREVAAAARSS